MNQALKHLCKQTNTIAQDWTQINGLATGVGNEYWYRHNQTGQEAYICIDQGEVIAMSL